MSSFQSSELLKFPIAGLLLPASCFCIACGSKEHASTTKRDGGDAAVVIKPTPDAAPTTPPGAAPPYLLADLADAGEVTVRVEWKDATSADRTSRGRDPCGNARPARGQVHTLHGLADAVVWLDVPAGKAPPAEVEPVEVGLRDCRLHPMVQVAGRVDAPLVIAGLDERRAAVTVTWADAIAAPETEIVRAELVVVGDAVKVPLDRPGLAGVTTDASSDPAYVVIPAHPYVAVTDETGAAVFADVPPGTYDVHAWHPSGRAHDGAVTVEPGGEITVTLP